MIGVALFSSIFGLENLHNILLIGLGHEFFIWFFYAPLLKSKNMSKMNIRHIIKSFFKSPIILAIISAILLNLTGIYSSVSDYSLSGGIISTITMISQLVTPLILLTVGYNLQFKNIPWKAGIHLIGLRIITVGILGALLVYFTKVYVMDISKIMGYAFVIFFLLPPPYIIPVFLGRELKKEGIFYNNLLVISTIVTFILFMIIMLIFGL